jgi:large subunit ribosomal protein L30
MSEKTLRVKYVKSSIGYSRRQKWTIRALGFKRLGDVIEVKDTGAIRGMLNSVIHLVQVEQAD